MVVSVEEVIFYLVFGKGYIMLVEGGIYLVLNYKCEVFEILRLIKYYYLF